VLIINSTVRKNNIKHPIIDIMVGKFVLTFRLFICKLTLVIIFYGGIKMSIKSVSLNGIWNLIKDDKLNGREKNYQLGFKGGIDAKVPGSIAMYYEDGGIYWYQTKFEGEKIDKNDRVFLSFGGVEYICEIYLNGEFLGSHEGKHTGFNIEATKAYKEGENLLVLRVNYPAGGCVEGFNGPDILGHTMGGGIFFDVTLNYMGEAILKSYQVYGNIHTGNIEVDLDTEGKAVDYEISVWDNLPAFRATGFTVKGKLNGKIEIPVKDFKFWSPQSPYLYIVNIKIFYNGVLTDSTTVRTGFREFKVDADGSFMLNGKRVLLKCAHGGVHTPYLPISNERNLDACRHFLVTMKSAGFNAIRYLHSIAAPEVFDYCDEIGLMVYQEHGSSWKPCGYPVVMESEGRQPAGEVERKFYNDLTQQIMQDRNHPSIVLWGLLNETVFCRRYVAARDALPLVRGLDKTRLVLLSSGSWDGDLENGSVCNPFSDKWECLWGEEGTYFKSEQLFEDLDNRRNNTSEKMPHIAAGYWTGSGDAHYYPTVQINTKYFDWMEKLGSGTHPVFLSEFGIGSLFDYPSLARRLENLPLTKQDNRQLNLAYENDEIIKNYLKENKLENVFQSAHELIEASYAEQAKYREQAFSMIRANPNIIGYSMTAVQDHGFAGEGFIGLGGELKRGHMTVMQEGWAPLRWCMITDPTHCYENEPIRLRAVLASEDELKPGKYPVTLKVYNDDETIWEKHVTLNVEAPKEGKMPLAFTVFDKKVNIEGLKRGEYTFSAVLEKGAFAVGGKVMFDVTVREDIATAGERVFLFGDVEEDLAELLYKKGVVLDRYIGGDCDRILVGRLNDKAEWDKVYEAIKNGAKAAFLDPYSLTEMGTRYDYLDECHEAVNLRRDDGSKAVLASNWEWLYHRIPVAKPDKIFDGLKARGIMDENYYNNVLDQIYVLFDKSPDEPLITAFNMNVVATTGVGPILGHMFGKNKYGKGSYIYNCLDLMGNIGHPAADRLVINIINELNK